MASSIEYASFFGTSLLNLKAPTPTAKAKETAVPRPPQSEERVLSTCYSYGFLSLPKGAVDRSSDGSTSTTTTAAAAAAHAASSLHRPRSPVPDPDSVCTAQSPSKVDDDDELTSPRGLTSCRQSYANYNKSSAYGFNWGSSGHTFFSSGKADKSKKKTRAAERRNPLPTIASAKGVLQRRTVAKGPASVMPPTPPSIEIDFSADDNDPLRRNENKTQQFFRLAQEHRDKRVRLMKKKLQEMKQQRKQEEKARRASRAKPQIYVLEKDGVAPTPLDAAKLEEGHARRFTVTAPQPAGAFFPRLPHSQPGVGMQRPPPPRFLSFAPPPPPHMFARSNKREERAGGTNASLVSDGGYLMGSTALAHRWPGQGLRPPHTHVEADGGDHTVRTESLTSSFSSSSSSSSSALSSTASSSLSSDQLSLSSGSSNGSTCSRSLPAGERELWGVCPNRDFPMIVSPNWRALEGDDCGSFSDSDEEEEEEEEEEGVSVSMAEPDSNESTVSVAEDSHGACEATNANHRPAQPHVLPPPPLSSQQRQQPPAPQKANIRAAVHTATDGAKRSVSAATATPFTSRAMERPTADLTDSSSSSSDSSDDVSIAGGYEIGSFCAPRRHGGEEKHTSEVAVRPWHSEEVISARDRGSKKLVLRRRLPSRADSTGAVEPTPPQSQRSNGFRRVFQRWF